MYEKTFGPNVIYYVSSLIEIIWNIICFVVCLWRCSKNGSFVIFYVRCFGSTSRERQLAVPHSPSGQVKQSSKQSRNQAITPHASKMHEKWCPKSIKIHPKFIKKSTKMVTRSDLGGILEASWLQVAQKDATSEPKGTQRVQKGAQRYQKWAEREPAGTQRKPLGGQGGPKVSQRRSRGDKKVVKTMIRSVQKSVPPKNFDFNWKSMKKQRGILPELRQTVNAIFKKM